MIPHYCVSFVLTCISLTWHEHASRIQQATLVWRQKPAAIHEHTHCTTTKQDNRVMRPKTDSTNYPTKVTNTRIYGRHKYLLLVHTTSTYVPVLYSKLEHRVLWLIGWPLSSFLQLDRLLNFSLGIHRNAHSDRLSYCSSLIRNNTSSPMKHANPWNAINVSFCFFTTQTHTLGIRTSDSMCVKRHALQRAYGSIGFASQGTCHKTTRPPFNMSVKTPC